MKTNGPNVSGFCSKAGNMMQPTALLAHGGDWLRLQPNTAKKLFGDEHLTAPKTA